VRCVKTEGFGEAELCVVSKLLRRRTINTKITLEAQNIIQLRLGHDDVMCVSVFTRRRNY